MPNTAPVYTVSFTWTFTGDDLTADDDKGYYVINGAATFLASWTAQFDNNSSAIPITGNKTIVLTAGQTLGFRVLSEQNRVNVDEPLDYDGAGYLKIENFDVQTSIPFQFSPHSGIVCLAALWGVYRFLRIGNWES